MKTDRLLRVVPVLFAVLVAGYLVGRSVVLDWYSVPTASMEPTIKSGSSFVPVLKCAYQIRVPFSSRVLFHTGKPRLGDVVLLKNPAGSGKPFFKRIVALAGQSVEMKNETLLVDGVAQPLRFEPEQKTADGDAMLLGHTRAGTVDHDIVVLPERPALRSFGPVTVPEGHVFVLGDNRDVSRDSRFFGARPEADLWGRLLR